MNRRGFLARAAAIAGSILAACSPGAIRLAEASEEKLRRDHPLMVRDAYGRVTKFEDGELTVDWTTVEPEPWLDMGVQDRMWENIEPRMDPPGMGGMRSMADAMGRKMYGTVDRKAAPGYWFAYDPRAYRRLLLRDRRPYRMRLIES